MRQALALAAYSALLRVGTPAYLARLWWRGRHEPDYRRAWPERLGLGLASVPPEGGEAPRPLWLHAVSLGETRAAAPLLQALRALRPHWPFLLTHGTATGRAAGAALLQSGDRQVWLPWDTPGAVRRFLERQRPALGVVMETEVWPNLLHEAGRRGLPLVLANARLSARSAARGHRLAPLLHPAVACFDRVLAQTDADALRLQQSGARGVTVMGNLKFDRAPDAALVARGQAWRARVGRPVVMAASTREGEEEPLLQAWAAMPGPRPVLMLVPRHPQRFDAVAALIEGAGLRACRRSAWPDGAPDAAAATADVWLGDSLGEMPLYYAAADLALLGGSFAPLGGQNLIEAAACACPVVMGPHTFNFAEAAEGLLAAGAGWRVADVTAAVALARALLLENARRAQAANAAQAFALQHRGAAARMAQAIVALADERHVPAAP